jgi:hypothetical protein
MDSNLTVEHRNTTRGWYGYRLWSAPYWFVSIEPGGDELDACVRMFFLSIPRCTHVAANASRMRPRVQYWWPLAAWSSN